MSETVNDDEGDTVVNPEHKATSATSASDDKLLKHKNQPKQQLHILDEQDCELHVISRSGEEKDDLENQENRLVENNDHDEEEEDDDDDDDDANLHVGRDRDDEDEDDNDNDDDDGDGEDGDGDDDDDDDDEDDDENGPIDVDQDRQVVFIVASDSPQLQSSNIANDDNRENRNQPNHHHTQQYSPNLLTPPKRQQHSHPQQQQQQQQESQVFLQQEHHHQQQEHHHHQQQQMSHRAHVQLILNALEKLDPEQNGLEFVPKEITSSTLTTRLKGVCRINRLIETANSLCHSINEIGAHTRYQERVDNFRAWILCNNIIEHIFGPNCHVEIIKQSHTILNFVAHSLTDEHVNVIWSASLLKHCGRQVLDLLTSLIRFMRPGPVLRLYHLVKNLNMEDHSEHTLILTSHILRYIWSHSPCMTKGNDAQQQHQHYHNQQIHQQHQQQQQLHQQQNQFHQADHLKQNVVDHILKSVSSDSSKSPSQQMKQRLANENEDKQRQSSFENLSKEKEWYREWKSGSDFLDNTSDVSACCSEEKNMDDFDDEVQGFIQDENSLGPADAVLPDEDGDEIFHQNSEAKEQQKLDRQIGTNQSAKISQHMDPSDGESHDGSIAMESDIKAYDTAYDDEIVEQITIDSNSISQGSDRITPDPSIDQKQQQQQPQLPHYFPLESITHFKELKKASIDLSNCTGAQASLDEDLKALAEYNLSNISDQGKTLLWDLLQDGNIEHLSANLHIEVENVLVNLVMSFGDRYIRYKFIEACLENLTLGNSVIISLRLLPKFMSFNPIMRNLSRPAMNETHAIVLWAEKEYSMSENFFKNLVQYYKQRQASYGNKISSDSFVESSEEISSLGSKSPLFSHIDKIITRMSFLTFIYSKPFSPENMMLSREQMDQLWDCLANDMDLKCSDVLFQWIYQQAVSEEFHGVNDELLDYVLKFKLPSLAPENFRLRGLKLLEQLLWIRQELECCHGLDHPATRLLWDIGIKATDDEVSMAAIRILNHFYIYSLHNKSTKCDKGVNFINYCMRLLQSSLTSLTNSEDQSSKSINQQLDVMQKVILLIRTHLEVFKAHWSYYLRILQLNNEADLISHRLNAYDIKLSMTVRLVCQAASTMDKTTIEVQAGDFVGELRAEIVKWWYSQVDRTYFEQSTARLSSPSPTSLSSASSSANANSSAGGEHSNHRQQNPLSKRFYFNANQEHDPNSLNCFTEFLLANQHSLRLLSHNQEIPHDWDERQINELDFKDLQVIYVLNEIKSNNIDSTDDLESDKSNETNTPPNIPKTEIPPILLLRQEYFERLMEADRFLGSFRSDNPDLTNRAKTLSRRVWEIIQILPTCPHYKEDLRRCGIPNEDWRLKTAKCSDLLNAECPQKLLYSLQIIDILKSSNEITSWGDTFIRKGGLADIYDVFMSQKLLPSDNEDWNEWLQECLAYLLKLLFQFGTKSQQSLANESSSSSSSSKMSVSTCSGNMTFMTNPISVKRIRRGKGRAAATTEERLPIPLFSEELLKLLANTELVFSKLIWILKSSALCRSQSDQYYYVTMSSRAMIVHHVMSFLSSWCKSDPKFPRFQVSDYEQLLKALILNDTDSSTRREACNGFFKLHYACSTKSTNSSIESINSTLNSSLESLNRSSFMQSNNQEDYSQPYDSISNWTFSADLLKCLIKFLPIAEAMKPPRPIRNYVSESDFIRDLNSPGCKDYFWLTCRLIDSQAITDQTLSKSFRVKRASSSSSHSDYQPINNKRQQDVTSPNNATTPESTTSSMAVSSPPLINLFELCEYLVIAIRNRRTYESRDFSVEDDTLRGMLLMMVMALRRDPSFRYTDAAFEFLHELYQYLFQAPNQKQRYLPKCKSPATRSTAFDLMLGLVERCPRNFFGLLDLLDVDQHHIVVKGSYPTDYWPHDDCRSEVGFVGLINLGATCYLATCMQHLFMIPNLRYAILSINDTKTIRHGEIIRELQKIFTFLLESERKAYNPRNFCKVYTMDNHPLNIAEQTDMTEFLTDLMTKLEESSPELRHIIKSLFSGTLSNNVVSLDCPHISRTTEEFYTLRVQVADMRNLNDSLDELTVNDTLEGDNMYTCSTCEKKVRAEKRACIVKLPRILCFNTMRYTFNMATMTKEKVNTHFSFPLKLDMADYLEENLMKRQQQTGSSAASGYSSSRESLRSSSSSTNCSATVDVDPCKASERRPAGDKQESVKPSVSHPNPTAPKPSTSAKNSSDSPQSASGNDEQHQAKLADERQHNQTSETVYELIGVTVHTGNADGGHYYCFIRDCEDQTTDKPRWYLFNDAEVKPFDDSHIGSECYGGELTTKSYDAINDRFMDFSIEKTNSAYMLFYKRVDYKYHSKSVACRYLESDTERATSASSVAAGAAATSETIASLMNRAKIPAQRQYLSKVSVSSVDADQLNSSNSSSEPMEMDQDESIDDISTGRASRLIEICETNEPNVVDDDDDDDDDDDHNEGRVNLRRNLLLHHSDDRHLNLDQGAGCAETGGNFDFNELSHKTYEDFELPRHLASWIWIDNMKFARDKNLFEHNYFNFMWQICANIPRTLNQIPEHLNDNGVQLSTTPASEDEIAIRTVSLAIAFVLGVLMNSRERPNLSNWTELIRKQFHSSKAACDWLMRLIDEEETWLKQMLMKCPIEMVRQLFQRLCNDLTGSTKHKKLRLVR